MNPEFNPTCKPIVESSESRAQSQLVQASSSATTGKDNLSKYELAKLKQSKKRQVVADKDFSNKKVIESLIFNRKAKIEDKFRCPYSGVYGKEKKVNSKILKLQRSAL